MCVCEIVQCCTTPPLLLPPSPLARSWLCLITLSHKVGGRDTSLAPVPALKMKGGADRVRSNLPSFSFVFFLQPHPLRFMGWSHFVEPCGFSEFSSN